MKCEEINELKQKLTKIEYNNSTTRPSMHIGDPAYPWK